MLEKYQKYRKYLKPGKDMFWIWVFYQSVKGTLTMSFIWIPAIMLWLHK